MTEIIIAVIIQLSTLLGGLPADKNAAENNGKSQDKKEQPIKGSGGSGTWQDN